jgi:formylglycine-generating enzyme required for sulfatase activity
MALLFEKGLPPESSRTRLYDQIFQLLLEGKHRPEGEAIAHRDTVHCMLRRLGHGMTEDNRDTEPEQALLTRLYQPEQEALVRQLERHPRWRRGLEPFLKDLAERTGILGPHDGEDADWRYWHRTFREALAAERLEEMWEDPGGQEAVLAHARALEEEQDLSRWAEPYALLAGRVKEGDALVSALATANRPLARRALATAQGVSEATVHQVLELSDKWQERAKIYLRVPELLGEAERALPLLERLRKNTSKGGDLYFLDRAYASLAERWPEARGEAEAHRARLFDHIPAPQEALFREIDTPLDGKVALWREIPAGSGQVGSPKEEGGDDDERPCHRVTLKSPFALGAVPITNAQYAAFDPEQAFKEGQAHHPRAEVTWFEASIFCRWLASLYPWAAGARLPLEEEWEYACRAGSSTRYWCGDGEEDLEPVAWYKANSENRTHRVGRKPANPWGLYDVHGNVWEWTLGPFSMDSYAGREKGHSLDPRKVRPEAEIDPASGVSRVMRGGCYWGTADWARSAFRDFRHPRGDWRYHGFRVLLPHSPRAMDGRS